MIGEEDHANYPVRNILEAASMPVRPLWRCSGQEYARSLSH